MEALTYPGRLGIQQRVLPAYRAPFFDALAAACQGGLMVFAGQPLPDEGIAPLKTLYNAQIAWGTNHYVSRPGSPYYRCRQEGLLEWLESWQPDALIVEANPRYPATRAAIRWMHAHGRPVLGWGLGSPPLSGLLASWRLRSRLQLLRAIDGVIAYSQRGAQQYQALGLPAGRVFVAPNAGAARPTQPPPERPEQFSGQPVVLFVGRLQKRKRIDNLLRACAALPEPLRPRLWIVGDGPARQELQSLAAQIYLQAKFMGGLYGLELEGLFAQADLFVLPGTGGLAVQQAMAWGLPVIVAEGDGTQDDLVRVENGWKIPDDDLNALITALEGALSDPVRLRQKGAASYRIVLEEINVEQMAAAFVRVLNSVEARQ